MESLETAGGFLFLLLGIYVAAEMAVLHFRRHALRLREARTTLFGALSVGVAVAIALRLALPVSVALFASAGIALSPVGSLGTGVLAWIAGWLVYEFWYWFQHWAAHQVRLLWCIHSPHHAPRSIHMMVGANHHFVESALYMPFFAGFMPALFGIEPVICVALNLVDGIWGSFLHISDQVVPKGRYGVLGRFLQTPAHHRVHHARNVRYLDRNYNSITLFWDWALGTLEPLRDEEPPDYGITREVDTGSFWDVHFRELVLLARDVRATRGLDRLRVLWKPPGWRPGDASHTAAARRGALIRAGG
ncbi:sterol desaturase family protein [Nocardioides sp.]|uniref:sterol desaturase family protein n=1 Tax=Nocardioides sp. TaxID=35761 RepID=UPI00261E104D|nr:sterol desaturase family protein [Nocardioides sp.]